jgi:2-octaprenyl-6-methoxyphenol hydroxylase
MKNKIHKYDFLVVGAGLIGALTALELMQKKFKVLVIEKSNKTIMDKRTLAVNANSKEFLCSLNLWQGLSNEPIKQIIIGDEINNSPLNFENSKEPMGFVVYNKDLLIKARSELLKKKSLIENINIDLEKIKPNSLMELKNQYYSFDKIILSMGKNHSNGALLKKNEFKSNHTSLVGFFKHSINHDNKAYETFTKKGPLAVLPAPSSNKKFSTFIYSTKESIQGKDLKKIIKKLFSQTHGQIYFIGDFKYFKIAPHLTMSNIQNTFLVGDSLRSIHPVAGQGWNLGVKDIQTLSSLIDQYGINDENIYSIYLSRRKLESSAYLSFTNFLNSLYENDDKKINKLIIKIGFQSLLRLSPIRRIFIKQAMGRVSLI